MYQGNYVFTQLTSFLNRSKFNRIVDNYSGNKYVKHFSCWNQLLVLMFGQLSNRESLRDVIAAIEAHSAKSYHLGFGKNVSKTSLARANEKRNYRIFEEYAFYLAKLAQEKRKIDIFKLNGKVYAFDSSTISLCLKVFWWAKFRKNKGGIKLHVLYDVETQIPAFFHITTASKHDSTAMEEITYQSGAYYIFDRAYNKFKELNRINTLESYFVVRAKSNLQYKTLNIKENLPKNVLLDAQIELTVPKSHDAYPEELRLIKFYDEEKKRELLFLTNAFKPESEQIANLYKNRWQIELFFKWLKQHLKIKKFWGTTENAVRIQICAAISAYCLVALVQHELKLERSTYEILQILSMSLTDTMSINELFSKTKCKKDKQQSNAVQLSLFDDF